MFKNDTSRIGKYFCVAILIGVEICLFFLMHKSFNNKDAQLTSVNLNNRNNVFAIMLEQEDGTYLEPNGDWEIGNRVFDEEKSGCIDVNGNKLENVLTYENGIATVDTANTSYCYLYFSFPEQVE